MKITVYKGQFGFSTLAKNGEDKMYIQVQFRKGQEPEGEKTQLKINEGFFSMYKTNTGLAKPKLVILDYIIEENNNIEDLPFTEVDMGDDLPF